MASAEPARAARAALQAHLDAQAPDIARSLPSDFFDRVERYVWLLLAKNEVLNLTRVTEPQEVARLHLLDALSALPVLDALAPERALDLGSGGGVPGLVLALARPQVTWTLVDSVGKKCRAMQEFVEDLGLGTVTVLAARAEELGHHRSHREAQDVVVARACAPMPVLAEYALPLVRVGGALLAWKGALTNGDDELVRGSAAASELGGGTPEVRPTGIPALGDHRLVLVAKERATPARYPRRPGEPARRPLG